MSRHAVLLACICLLSANLPDATAAQDSTQELGREIAALKSQLEALESRLEAMEGATTASALPPRTPQSPVASASIDASTESTRQALHLPPITLPSRDSVSDPSTSTSRIENRPPPTDPQLRGFFTSLDTDTMTRIGGYAKVDALYDFRNSGEPAATE